jgi:hypothetical protein
MPVRVLSPLSAADPGGAADGVLMVQTPADPTPPAPGSSPRDLLGLALRAGVRAATRKVRPTAAGPVSSTSAQDRGADLVALGSRLGMAEASHRARRTFASVERKAAMDEAHQLRTAADVTAALGGMKGVLMKLAQMQSYLDDSLPPAWRDALAGLQADAPPMAPELAAEVVVAELGAPPEELFQEWDPRPVAAASVGQVHRAITRDARAVAVKVQYPGAGEALQGDLDNVPMLLSLMARMQNDDSPEVDLAPLLAELRLRVAEESDYRREAHNQQQFADYFAGHPTIRVPATLPDLSGSRVLTSELFAGVRFSELLDWSQEQRDLAGETVFRFVFHSVFRMGVYNGDPHPGNYLFAPDGEVCFLDFGLCRAVEPEVTEALGTLFRLAVLGNDPAAFRVSLEELGFLRPGAPVSTELVYERVAGPWRSLLCPEVAPMPLPVTDMRPPDDEGRALAAAFTLPPTFLLLTTRTLIGMQALIARMGSRRAWLPLAEEIWPFCERGPTTPMGEAERAWRAAAEPPAPASTGADVDLSSG